VEGQDEIALFSCDCDAGTLSQQGHVTLPAMSLPSSLAFDAAGRLWVAGGAQEGSAACLVGVTERTDQVVGGVQNPILVPQQTFFVFGILECIVAQCLPEV
jgi:hypothetical protein